MNLKGKFYNIKDRILKQKAKKEDVKKKLHKEKKTIKQIVQEAEVQAKKKASGKYKKMPFVTVVCNSCSHKVYYKCKFCVMCHSEDLKETTYHPQYNSRGNIEMRV